MPNDIDAASVLVLGAGSIGRRHAKNLAAAGAHVWLADPEEERARNVPRVHAIPFDLDRLDGYDGIVIASPTAFHASQALAALGTQAKILVEKPLATSVADAAAIVEHGQGRIMVGYNLRFHQPLERIATLLEDGIAGRILGARLWAGSYLPDWRASTDYRASYSARSELGGGILFDSIHELDIAIWFFGGTFRVAGAVVTRVGNLDIDVEDTVKAVLLHSTGAVVDVSLDYLSRRYRRGIEVIGTEATVRLDWARDAIEIENAAEIVAEPVDSRVSRSYELEIERFLRWISEGCEPPVDAVAGAASVALADEIRRAAIT